MSENQSQIKGKIRVIFHQKFGDAYWRVAGEKVVNTLKLNDNQVHFNKRSFVIDTAFVKYFDKKGTPIIEFDINSGVPLGNKLVNGTNEAGKIPSSKVWYEMFRLQKLKAILQSATKAKESAPWYIYLLLGAMIGVVAGIIIYPYAFPSTVVHVGH